MRISVYTSKELQAVLTRLKQLDKDVQAQIRRTTRQDALPIWQQETRTHAHTKLERQVLAGTARVAVSSQNITVQSARIGRPLKGGLAPKKDWRGVEFGANRNETNTYQARDKHGRQYEVKRHTQRQFKPRKKNGYVVYPAVAAAVPRLASLWVQTVMRTTFEAFED